MYDTIIIGGGPAGYLAAERLGGCGRKVLLIEEQNLGGTCLNAGCIPTKTLVHSAKLYAHAKGAGKYGVNAEAVSYDWAAIQKWKAEVVGKMRGGIESQMKRFGVEVINSRGEILEAPKGEKPAKVRSLSHGASVVHEGKTVLVCAGSVPVMPPIPGVKDNPSVIDSAALLEIGEVPERLAVIGGGVIGVEFAGLFSALGSEVTVIEMMDEIVPFMDREQAPLLRRAMRGVNFKLGCKVEKIEKPAAVHYTAKNGKAEILEAGLVLMAAGRRPVLDGWGAAAAGLDTAGSKGVAVDDRMRTNVPGIWAAGDVTGKSLLAHSAYRMAEVAVTDILAVLSGGAAGEWRMRYNAIPWAVYGITEAAGVGLTEQEAEAKNISVLKAVLPMRVSGRFVAENTLAGQGAVKVIADAGNRRILGVHAVGAYSPEFIWGGAALIEQELRIDDVKQLVFPHPTVSEVIRDVIWSFE